MPKGHRFEEKETEPVWGHRAHDEVEGPICIICGNFEEDHHTVVRRKFRDLFRRKEAA